jgi:hypothetical protein
VSARAAEWSSDAIDMYNEIVACWVLLIRSVMLANFRRGLVFCDPGYYYLLSKAGIPDLCRGSPLVETIGEAPWFAGRARLDDYLEYIASCRGRLGGRGPSEAFGAFFDLLIKRLRESLEQGDEDFGQLWFLLSRIIPTDLMEAYISIARRRGGGCPAACTPGEIYGAARYFPYRVEDYHVHLGALPEALLSWLARIHPRALWGTLHMAQRFAHRVLRGGYTGAPGEPRLDLKLYLSYRLYPVYRAALEARLAYEYEAAGHALPPGLARGGIRFTYRRPHTIEQAWNSLARRSNGSLRVLDALGGNDYRIIRGIEEAILRDALNPHTAGRGKADYAGLYLALRMYAHSKTAGMAPHGGLSHFREVFAHVSKSSRGPRRRRVLSPRYYAILTQVDDGRPATRWIRLSFDRGDIIATERALQRARRVGDFYVLISFVKRAGWKRSFDYICGGARRPVLYGGAFRDALRTIRGLESIVRGGPGLRRVIYPMLRERLRGIDVAGQENAVDNWVYAPFIAAARALLWELALGKGWSPVVSYHVGEDYENLISGLRRIYEVVELIGLREPDRLGHALALSLYNYRKAARLRVIDEMVNAAFEWSLYAEGRADPPTAATLEALEASVERLSEYVFGTRLTPMQVWDAWALLHTGHPITAGADPMLASGFGCVARHLARYLRPRINTPSSGSPRSWAAAGAYAETWGVIERYLVDKRAAARAHQVIPSRGWATVGGSAFERLRRIRDLILERLRARRVRVEVCATSNAVTQGAPPKPHPLTRLEELEGLLVPCTDDPSVIDTSPEIEAFMIHS